MKYADIDFDVTERLKALWDWVKRVCGKLGSIVASAIEPIDDGHGFG